MVITNCEMWIHANLNQRYNLERPDNFHHRKIGVSKNKDGFVRMFKSLYHDLLLDYFDGITSKVFSKHHFADLST